MLTFHPGVLGLILSWGTHLGSGLFQVFPPLCYNKAIKWTLEFFLYLDSPHRAPVDDGRLNILRLSVTS